MKTRKSCAGALLKTGVVLLCAYLAVYFGGAALLRSVFPLKYEAAVQATAQETGLPPALLFAVIKVESDFDPQAESHAGARGLMQMIPETFAWIQEKTHGEVQLGEEALLDPEANIWYGSLLLKLLLERYGDIDTALCAYNAGIGAVDSWLLEPDYSPNGRVVSQIPYGETRRYVRRIALARRIYEKLYGLA